MSGGVVLASRMPGRDSIGVGIGIGIGIEGNDPGRIGRGCGGGFDSDTDSDSDSDTDSNCNPEGNQRGGEMPNEALHQTGATESGRASRVTGAAWGFLPRADAAAPA